MNSDQLTSVLRIVVPGVLAWAVGKGWLSQSGSAAISETTINAVVAFVMLASAVWSVRRNSDASQIRRVARLSSVRKVLMHDVPDSLALNPKVARK